MAFSYWSAIALIALLTLSAVQRWSEPSPSLSVLNEANHVAQAMRQYARKRCLADLNDEDGSTLTTELLSEADYVSVVQLMNIGYLEAERLGFAANQSLPIADSPENQTSLITGLRWMFIGWHHSAAMVQVSAESKRVLSAVHWLFPTAVRVGQLSLRVVLYPSAKSATSDSFAHISSELIVDHGETVPTGSKGFSREKLKCFI